MTSGKQARRQRQAQARPPTRSTEGRRASPLVLLAALAGLGGLAVAIALIFLLGGGGSDSSASGTTLPDADVIEQQLGEIPQRGNVLGRANAPVTLVEYIDLQCPICRQFETEVMPTIIERYVRPGKVKVEARIIAFIGPDSERGRDGAIAAAEQNRLFNFTQLLYFNQGAENGGWLDDSMVASAATSVPGVDVGALQDAISSSDVSEQAQRFDQQATADGINATPTVLVGKTGARPTSLGAGSPPVATLSAAIERALR